MRDIQQEYEDFNNNVHNLYERGSRKKYESTTEKACINKNHSYNQVELSEIIEKKFNSLNLNDKKEVLEEMNIKALEFLEKDLPTEYKNFWTSECPKDKVDWELWQWEEEEKRIKDFENYFFKKFNENIKRDGLTRIAEICKTAIERLTFVRCEYTKKYHSDLYKDLEIAVKAIKSFKEAIYYQPKNTKPLRTFKNFDKKIFIHISKAISNIPNLTKEQAVNTAVEIMYGISSGTLKDKVSNDEMKAIDMGICLVKSGRWNRPSGMPSNG